MKRISDKTIKAVIMKVLHLMEILSSRRIAPIFIIVLVACKSTSVDVKPFEPEEFLTEVMDVMEDNSINRSKINWLEFREKVLQKSQGSQTLEDTYPAILEALALLNDNHSSFRVPGGGSLFAGTITCDQEDLGSPSTPDNIGYVTVNSFSGPSNGEMAISFAEEIQNQIRSQDNQGIKGWIVDLRNNGGGNMWPMLAGIGPVLGEGIAGYFINPDGNESSWSFVNGTSIVNGSTPVTRVVDSYKLKIPNPKVAVLLNEGIASSGEVVAISFIGRENTKSFGAPTCGLSTANAPFTMSNGSTLILTVAYLADRNKTKYGVPIEPDVSVEVNNIIQSAIEWLEE